MRLDPGVATAALGGLAVVAGALAVWRGGWTRPWAIVLAGLAVLDGAINVAGYGPLLWWSPLHWPSTLALGVDEIVERQGVLKTTAAYLGDLFLWSAVIALGIGFWRRKQSSKRPGAPP